MGFMTRVIAYLRWAWRSLTSMRTALFLLFLLAIASVPGSLFPQRGTTPLKVNQYLRDHPQSGPFLDKIHMFDVFASPWFGAIYLLLFVSLTGCVLPRTLVHWKELRSEPPSAPRNLSRLTAHESWNSQANATAVADVAKAWKDRGWRVRTGDSWVAAERGYARETGNLLFHLALLFVLLAVGSGSALGTKGTVIVREGSGFANNITQYDTFTPGRAFNTSTMAPFSFQLKNFFASYQLGGMQNGAPREFHADVLVKNNPDSTARKVRIAVNEPLRIEGSSVYLVGHGYSPKITIKDGKGNVVWQDAAIFLPQDGNFTSTGVVKAPDTVPQLGIQAFFLPTAAVDMTQGPHSTFPAPTDPMVFMSVWSGDLGLDSGVPQSVFRLDTTKMKKIGLERLKPGQTYKLPDGQGSITFDGYKEWASFSITHDPGKGWALGAGMLAILGLTLSLLVPRRRAWLRITESENGTSLVEVAGLSKTEAPGLVAEISSLASTARTYIPEVLHGDQ